MILQFDKSYKMQKPHNSPMIKPTKLGGVILIAVVFDQILAARRRARESRLDIKAAPAETVAAK